MEKTTKARNFLTTCKYYYTSKELIRAIVGQFTTQLGFQPRAFVFAPLYISSPTAYDCLEEWLQSTTEISNVGVVTPDEKIKFLDYLLKVVTHGHLNPNGRLCTDRQKEHLRKKITEVRSLVQIA